MEQKVRGVSLALHVCLERQAGVELGRRPPERAGGPRASLPPARRQLLGGAACRGVLHVVRVLLGPGRQAGNVLLRRHLRHAARVLPGSRWTAGGQSRLIIGALRPAVSASKGNSRHPPWPPRCRPGPTSPAVSAAPALPPLRHPHSSAPPPRTCRSRATEPFWQATMVLTCSSSSSRMLTNTSYSVLRSRAGGKAVRTPANGCGGGPVWHGEPVWPAWPAATARTRAGGGSAGRAPGRPTAWHARHAGPRAHLQAGRRRSPPAFQDVWNSSKR